MRKFINSTRLIVNINDENFAKFMKMADIMDLKTIVIDEDDVLSIDGKPVAVDKKIYVEDMDQTDPDLDEHASVEAAEPEMILPTMADNAQDQAIEPENIDKAAIYKHSDPFIKAQNIEPENLGQDFLRAQLSTKNQMKIRNVLAIFSTLGVVIAFILEKLGII